MISKKLSFSILVLAVAGVIAVGLQKGWIGKRITPTEMAKSNGSVSIELSETDIAVAQTMTMTQGVLVTGTLKAVRTAMVKARVAGELVMLEVREGDAVKMGQIVARVDNTEYLARQRQAQQQAEAARAQVDVTQRQFDNNNALVDQGFISKTALDTSMANLNGAKASYQAALSALDVSSKALDDSVLKAPLQGFVSQRFVQPGERVAPEARIIEIVDLSQLELEATLTSAEAMNVKVGQIAKLNVEGTSQEVSAKVLRINPSTQTGSRSVLVYLGLQSHPLLRQGVFVQGSLGTQKVQAVVVPLESVRSDKTKPYVQTLQDNQVVHLQVELGAKGEADGKAVMALKEIKEGTRVLAPSAGAVRDGTLIDQAVKAPGLPTNTKP
ncbi:MAG: efflux RND transporter periplasmic adaptor subunit [Burkholderiales bacterium]|nr:efflux RND transporter periplasmic adaptor subunit [Burkholderiales bacterium]